MRKGWLIIAGVLIAISVAVYLVCRPSDPFSQHVKAMRAAARQAGVSTATLNRYLSDVTPPTPTHHQRYLHRQSHQAGRVLTFSQYRDRLIPASRYPEAKKNYQRYRQLVTQIGRRYGVDPTIMTAIWGIESHYGHYTGTFPLVRSLLILAYHPHRQAFYQHQLISALTMLDRPVVIPEQLKSAWDGGMGQIQFEPDTYLAFAVDESGDGFANIWTNMPDIFASLANFLHKNGWHPNEPWGRQVKLTESLKSNEIGYAHPNDVAFFQAHGVQLPNGKPIPNLPGEVRLILPSGKAGNAYLIYRNFKVLMRWNQSVFEALSIGLLADVMRGP